MKHDDMTRERCSDQLVRSCCYMLSNYDERRLHSLTMELKPSISIMQKKRMLHSGAIGIVVRPSG